MIRHHFKKKKHKFHARQTIVDGIKFSSKKEARHYLNNKLRIEAGDLLFQLRQVPLHLPGNTRLVIDFIEFCTDGSVHFVDTKGYQTEVFKLKRRQVEELYPIEIEVI